MRLQVGRQLGLETLIELVMRHCLRDRIEQGKWPNFNIYPAFCQFDEMQGKFTLSDLAMIGSLARTNPGASGWPWKCSTKVAGHWSNMGQIEPVRLQPGSTK